VLFALVKGWRGHVEKVYAEECDDESYDEGKCVCGVRGVESLEEDERGYNCSARKADIVYGVYPVGVIKRCLG